MILFESSKSIKGNANDIVSHSADATRNVIDHGKHAAYGVIASLPIAAYSTSYAAINGVVDASYQNIGKILCVLVASGAAISYGIATGYTYSTWLHEKLSPSQSRHARTTQKKPANNKESKQHSDIKKTGNCYAVTDQWKLLENSNLFKELKYAASKEASWKGGSKYDAKKGLDLPDISDLLEIKSLKQTLDNIGYYGDRDGVSNAISCAFITVSREFEVIILGYKISGSVKKLNKACQTIKDFYFEYQPILKNILHSDMIDQSVKELCFYDDY